MEELDLKELLTIFWEKRLQIVLIVLIFAVIGIAYSYLIVKPEYQATTSLVLVQSTTDAAGGAITQADVTLNSKLVTRYEEMVTRDVILEKVVENLNNPNITIGSIKNKVSVKSAEESDLIDIVVKNADPNYAADIANEIAKVFCEKIVEIYNLSNTYIFERAKPATTPYNINHVKDIVIFVFIGFIVAIVYILVLNMLDNTIKTEQDIEKCTGLAVLTSIPDYEFTNKKGGRRK